MKKQIGIWLDFKQADIITLHGKTEPMVTSIQSDIDFGKIKGGSRSVSPWGPQMATSESKHTERRKHQESAYFEKIIKQVQDAEALYIFGPAEAKDGLARALKESDFHPQLLAVETADSMTLPQKIAKVREVFANALR
jgi:hypothetical protein